LKFMLGQYYTQLHILLFKAQINTCRLKISAEVQSLTL